MSYSITQPAVPALPISPWDYDHAHQERYSNVLRLYFNQLNNTLGNLVAAVSNPVIPNNESPYALPTYMQVARGLVTGVSQVNIFGYQGSVGTTFIPIWENATAYTYPGSATTMLLYSSSASDTAVQVLINGLDSSYNSISETLTLTNGTTGVTTVKSYLRVQSLFVVDGVNPVGTLTLGNAGKTVQYAVIGAGIGKSQMAIYTVPNGYTFYLTRVQATSNQVGNVSSSYCTYRVQSYNSSGISQVVLQTPFTNLFSVTRVAPFPYAAKTDLQFQANTPSSTAAIGIQVEGLLIATSTT